MSTKEYHDFKQVLELLVELTYELGRAVTAGELAKYCGVARSTAKRKLDRLFVMNEVAVWESTGKNHMTKREYERQGYGEEWRKAERKRYPGDL